jgi:hypothetical protein
LLDRQRVDTLPDWQVANILPEGVTRQVLADGVADPYTTRAMGLVPVTAHQATSVVGHVPELDSEFVISRILSSRPNHDGKTSGGHQLNDHRGNSLS